MKYILKLFTASIIAAFLCVSIVAQNHASLKLSVLDPKSDVVKSGTIRLFDKNGAMLAEKKIPTKGQTTFESLQLEKVIIQIHSPGFESFTKELLLSKGENQLTATLEIKKIEAKVEIEQSEIDRRLDRAFSTILSQEEIDSLPNDPREIEKELKRRYGDDITIRINGFTGGQIPPKEMIRSIQVNRSSFDAEYHELSTPNVNITTKASIPKYFGTLGLSYGNSKFNARNAFARTKSPEQNRSLFGLVAGPIGRKASFFGYYSNFVNTREENIVATLTGDRENVNEVSKTKVQNISGDFNFDIGKNLTLRLGYSHGETDLTNRGIGRFNLLERGFSVATRSDQLRVSLNGTLAAKFTQEFRSKISFENSEVTPNSMGIGIVVSDAFSGGGSGNENYSTLRNLEVFQMLSVGKGKNFVKFGGEFRYERKNLVSFDGINGTFFFRNLNDFRFRRPATYTVTEGIRKLKFDRTELSLFVQNDYRIMKRLQVGFGLRYEAQNQLADRNNFSPRISATYVLDEKAKFVLRSGVGILYDWFDSNKIQTVLSNDGLQTRQLIILNPGFPDPGNGGALQVSLPPSITKKADNLSSPTFFITQTALNADLGDGFKFNASYKFERGARLFRSRDINAPILGVRPDNLFGRIRQLESSGNLTRNSLELSGEGVLFKRVRVNSRYRFAKAIDDFDGAFALPVDNYNLRAERGTSSLDRRHFITANFDYSPFKDFRINPSFNVESPMPYTITTGHDDNGDTIFNDRPFGVSRNTTRGEWSKTINLSLNWNFPIFKRSVKTSQDGKSDIVQNIPDSLKYHKLNLTVSVNNVFNTVNRAGFVGNQLSPFFGQPTYSAPARSITFNLLFIYF